MVKTPLMTKFEGKPEQLRIHIQEITRRMKNTGLYQEFQIRLQENDKPDEIPDEDWTQYHPLPWQTTNFWLMFPWSVLQHCFKNGKE